VKSTALRASGLALTAALTLAAPAFAGPWLLQPKEYYSEFQGGTTRYPDWFNNDGSRVPFAGNLKGADYGLTIYNEFGWKEKLGVIFQIPFKSVTVYDDVNGDAATSTGFQDMSLGLRYALARGNSPVAVQVDWRGASGYNPKLTPPLGEGSQDLSGQLLVGASVPALYAFVQAAGGYRVRFSMRADTVLTESPRDTTGFDGGQAQEVFATADLGVWLGNQILLAANTNWVSQSGRGPTATSMEVSPRLIYRVDGGIDLILSSTHSIWGQNTAKSDGFQIGVAFKSTKLNRYQGYLGNAQRH
jgi:hypothetical protein